MKYGEETTTPAWLVRRDLCKRLLNGRGECDMDAHVCRIGWVVLLEIGGKGSRRSIRTGKIRPDLSPGTQYRGGEVTAVGEDEVLAGGDEHGHELRNRGAVRWQRSTDHQCVRTGGVRRVIRVNAVHRLAGELCGHAALPEALPERGDARPSGVRLVGVGGTHGKAVHRARLSEPDDLRSHSTPGWEHARQCTTAHAPPNSPMRNGRGVATPSSTTTRTKRTGTGSNRSSLR